MIIYREWESDIQYVMKQVGKVTFKDVDAGREKRVRGFTERFNLWKEWLLPGPVLCLGARTGCEVEGARQAGFAGSLGVDLQPHGKNVVQASWDHLPFFPDGKFANAYSNSLDHCRDLPKLVEEAKRVVKPGGTFVFEIQSDYALTEEQAADMPAQFARRPYNAMFWTDDMDVVSTFEENGFELVNMIKQSWNVYFLRRGK